MSKKETAPRWILSAYNSGRDLAQAHGDTWAQHKAKALRKYIRAGKGNGHHSRSTRAICAGLLNQEHKGITL